MAAPTLINTYLAGYVGTSTPISTNVTSQAGDLIVVVVQLTSHDLSITSLSGNGITFSSAYNNVGSGEPTIHILQGTDSVGGTNWSLQCNVSDEQLIWGFMCLVFRNTSSTSNTNDATASSGTAAVSLSTTSANSGVLAVISDASGADTNTASWNSTDGYTPTSGNGGKLLSIGTETYYGFYLAYFPDIGPASNYNFSMNGGGTMLWSMVAYELHGGGGGNGATISWLTA